MTNVFKWDKMSCHAPYMVMMSPLKNLNTTISLPLNKKRQFTREEVSVVNPEGYPWLNGHECIQD